MRILILSYDNYPHIGGKSTHIKNLANGLIEIGHQVKIISFADNLYINKLLLVRAPGYLLRKIPALGNKLAFLWVTYCIEFLHKRQITRELKTTSYDAISAQDASVSRICREVISNLSLKTPIITTVHGDQTNETLSAGIIARGSRSELWLLKREIKGYISSDLIISVDNRLKQHIILLCNNYINANNIEVMYNFLDTSEFSFISDEEKEQAKTTWFISNDKDCYYILCPRRLTPKNGVIYAAMMCKSLKQLMPDLKFKLMFAGDGGEKAKIVDFVKNNALDNEILLLGDITHEDMRNLYAIADVVIVPSVPSEGVIEATSLSALEAMACGIPLIASNIGGLADLITNKENGLLIEPKDYVAMAESVKDLIQQDNLRKVLRNNARQYVIDNHSHIHAATRFSSICKKAIHQCQI